MRRVAQLAARPHTGMHGARGLTLLSLLITRWDAEKVQSLWKLIAVNVAGLS